MAHRIKTTRKIVPSVVIHARNKDFEKAITDAFNNGAPHIKAKAASSICPEGNNLNVVRKKIGEKTEYVLSLKFGPKFQIHHNNNEADALIAAANLLRELGYDASGANVRINSIHGISEISSEIQAGLERIFNGNKIASELSENIAKNINEYKNCIFNKSLIQVAIGVVGSYKSARGDLSEKHGIRLTDGMFNKALELIRGILSKNAGANALLFAGKLQEREGRKSRIPALVIELPRVVLKNPKLDLPKAIYSATAELVERFSVPKL